MLEFPLAASFSARSRPNAQGHDLELAAGRQIGTGRAAVYLPRFAHLEQFREAIVSPDLPRFFPPRTGGTSARPTNVIH